MQYLSNSAQYKGPHTYMDHQDDHTNTEYTQMYAHTHADMSTRAHAHTQHTTCTHTHTHTYTYVYTHHTLDTCTQYTTH